MHTLLPIDPLPLLAMLMLALAPLADRIANALDARAPRTGGAA